jgi:hypothetical protein
VRKRNWNAGLTKAQHALATKILTEHMRAFDKEHADGTMGLPGSMWEIGSDGLAKCRAPSVRELVAGWQPTSKWH